MTRVVGLTGNIASGKSTVTAILRRLGVPVIDADQIVHELQRPGTAVFREIVADFGPAVLTPDGELDRAALRRMVLADEAVRRRVEAIVHPAVFERRSALVQAAITVGTPLVVVDVPLLYEADDPRHYDAVVLVDAPVALRRERLITLRGLPAEEADRLIALQLPAELKRERADVVIDNDGDIASLTPRVEQLVARFSS